MDKFDIIIQAGQSNAEGNGLGKTEEAFCPSSRIFTLDAEKTVEHFPENMYVTYADKPFVMKVAEERENANGKIGEFSLPFSAFYEKKYLTEGRKILLIRAAVGGSGFKKGQWTSDGILYSKLLEMTDYALSLFPDNRLVAFLWHQGEHDAYEKNSPNSFKRQLKELITNFRARYEVPNLPFIAGDFSYEWKNKNLNDCIPIVEKIKEVSNEIGNGGFVETFDLNSNNQEIGNGDDIHFCRAAQYELGRRYFDEFERILRELHCHFDDSKK